MPVLWKAALGELSIFEQLLMRDLKGQSIGAAHVLLVVAWGRRVLDHECSLTHTLCQLLTGLIVVSDHLARVVMGLTLVESLVDFQVLPLGLPDEHDSSSLHLVLEVVSDLHHALVVNWERLSILDEASGWIRASFRVFWSEIGTCCLRVVPLRPHEIRCRLCACLHGQTLVLGLVLLAKYTLILLFRRCNDVVCVRCRFLLWARTCCRFRCEFTLLPLIWVEHQESLGHLV